MNINDPIERKGEKAWQWRVGNNGFLGSILHFCKTFFEIFFWKKKFLQVKKKTYLGKKNTCKIKIVKKNVLVFMIQKTFYKFFK
jgi:hypothetical protein